MTEIVLALALSVLSLFLTLIGIILWVSYSSTNEKKHGSTEEKIAVKTKEKVTY